MLDSSLLRRLQHRDQDALEALTNKYRSYVCTIISNMITGTGTYSDVEELCDDAFLAGLKTVNIIHGRGSGILRKGLRAELRHNKHVESYKSAPYDQGGEGNTIVTLVDRT